MLNIIIDTIAVLSGEHSKVKHGIWKHIVEITGQQSDRLFPTDIENHVLKIHFDVILDFLIDYLEYGGLKVAVNLNLMEDRVKVERTTVEKVERIHNFVIP